MYSLGNFWKLKCKVYCLGEGEGEATYRQQCPQRIWKHHISPGIPLCKLTTQLTIDAQSKTQLEINRSN